MDEVSAGARISRVKDSNRDDNRDTEHQARNAASRQRLRDLVARLDDEALQRQVDDDWTIGAILAHMAFWDESCVVRWDAFDRKGAFTGLTDEVVELINTANLPTWRALSGGAVREVVLHAAERADARTSDLSEAALAYVAAADRRFILERFSHRDEHLDEIERALAR